MAPQDGREEDFVRNQRPGVPREEGIPRSATLTPEATLVTPITHDMRYVSLSQGSPTPDPPRGRQRRDLSPEVKMEDRKGKKRARFA
jgi:hypothetical protein